jgi:lipopolysaccharide/colanic/teichoic acid biosynthesis glycosyltransferase
MHTDRSERMKVTTKFASVEGSATLGGAPRSASLHALPGGHATPSSAAPAASWHPAPADNDALPDNLLSRAEFLRIVQREKRRTDRSHSALSLVLVEVDASQIGAADVVLSRLQALVRETDYAAAIDEGSVAVLLPDTGEAGLDSFLAKVAVERLAHVSSAVGATYPDASFDKLVAERMGTPRSRHALDQEPAAPTAKPGYPAKRALDVVGSVIALALLSPLFLVVATLIKLTSPGPVIFRQQRIGQGGVPFTFYKFRSMRVGNDDRVHREYVASLIDGQPTSSGEVAGKAGQFKMKADPRVTPIGRFIRKTSIDEIPQFWNVLKGDMSLVGPRPPVPYEADRYKAWHRRRIFDLKPGLTGIWQVEGRSKVSFDDMVRMDLRYLRESSLSFDLQILLKTVRVVVFCEGAQ